MLDPTPPPPPPPTRPTQTRRRLRLRRLPLLALGGLALLVGGWAGLSRQGALAGASALAGWHGPLMVLGFLGTVIGLERAVGLGARWVFAAPLLSALGAILLLVAPDASIPVFGAFAAIFLAAHLEMLRIQRAAHVVTMAVSAAMLLVGTLAWAGSASVSEAVPSWTAFLVLTIAGERLELSRVLRPSARARAGFAVVAGAIVVGALLGLVAPVPGALLMAAGEVGLAGWLFLNDIARHNARRGGLMRFTGLALLGGYAWLAVGGILVLVSLGAAAGGDAALHAVLLGFVMSMIFGHAPIVVRGVLGTPHPYTARLYVPAVLLHLSLLLRIGGDLAGAAGTARAGSLLGGLAILLFLANTVFTVGRQARRPGRAEALR